MADAAAAKTAMTVFERYLSLWVALCIVVGIALGAATPAFSQPLLWPRWPG
jgi:ACR3 family arsenite transporter